MNHLDRSRRYTPKHHYTNEELAAATRNDLERDIASAEAQALSGPFYPERGITRESLLAYAAKCRKEMQS